MSYMGRITTEGYGAFRDALSVAFWFKDDFGCYAKTAVRAHPELLEGISFSSCVAGSSHPSDKFTQK
jgi:hypothetical protein